MTTEKYHSYLLHSLYDYTKEQMTTTADGAYNYSPVKVVPKIYGTDYYNTG